MGPVGGIGNAPNHKSLALVLRFNNFRYYVGGDIATAQEGFIQTDLNDNDNAAGRVPVMKASHHGAETATSRGFINRLRPDTVIISCGTVNKYRHPAQQTVNILDGYPAAAVPHAAAPPAPPYRPIDYYLTGYQVVGPPPQSLGGDASLTAGDPTAAPVVPGHIVVRVSQPQSNTDVRGRLFIGVREATRVAGAAAGAPAGAAAMAGEAAGEAAILDPAAPPPVGVVAAAARAAATSLGAAPAVANQAAIAANAAIIGGINVPGPMATAVTGAVLGVGGSPVISAAAGAAAGAAIEDGAGLSIEDAVRAALVATGTPVAAADAAADAAAAAALAAHGVAGLFDLTYYNMGAAINIQNLTIV